MAFSMALYRPCVTKIKFATDPTKQRFSFPSQLNYSFVPLWFTVTLYQILLLLFHESWSTNSTSFSPGCGDILLTAAKPRRPLHQVYYALQLKPVYESRERLFKPSWFFWCISINFLHFLWLVPPSCLRVCFLWCFQNVLFMLVMVVTARTWRPHVWTSHFWLLIPQY